MSLLLREPEKLLILESQNAFKQGRSCIYSIFGLFSIVNEQLGKNGGKLYALFVDLRQVFDRISQDLLWRKRLLANVH